MHVKVEGICVKYGARVVLDALDMDVAPGEAVAVVGPSGSGKSTLLSVIGGAQEPTSGSVELVATSADQQLAWILQTVNVMPRRSVLDNVMVGGFARHLTTSCARAKAIEALRLVGIGHLLDHRARSVSGGERQRIVIARCVIGQPGLILADEPTAQLDRANAHSIATLLVESRSTTTTVIIATHDDEVAGVCDRILTLRDGKLNETG
jgi:ABC-type lipoprotein export system ATPase subunit